MKNSNDPIGNRTGDLPARSAVPQPTAPLHSSASKYYLKSKFLYHRKHTVSITKDNELMLFSEVTSSFCELQETCNRHFMGKVQNLLM
jgi:hypothetical protein